MGNNVLNEIISCIKLSKYFPILIDLTPDENHLNQITLVFRCIERDSPAERFLLIMPNNAIKLKICMMI